MGCSFDVVISEVVAVVGWWSDVAGVDGISLVVVDASLWVDDIPDCSVDGVSVSNPDVAVSVGDVSVSSGDVAVSVVGAFDADVVAIPSDVSVLMGRVVVNPGELSHTEKESKMSAYDFQKIKIAMGKYLYM